MSHLNSLSVNTLKIDLSFINEIKDTFSNLHLIAVDLGNKRLAEVMAETKDWNLGASSMIVAEGLLQYLSPEALRNVLAEPASISISGRFAFTFIPLRRDGKPDAGPCTSFVLIMPELTGEPWLWSIRPEELEEFVAALGWHYSPELLGSNAKHGVELYAVATHST